MFRQAGGIMAVSITTAILARHSDPGLAQSHVFWVFALLLVSYSAAHSWRSRPSRELVIRANFACHAKQVEDLDKGVTIPRCRREDGKLAIRRRRGLNSKIVPIVRSACDLREVAIVMPTILPFASNTVSWITKARASETLRPGVTSHVRGYSRCASRQLSHVECQAEAREASW